MEKRYLVIVVEGIAFVVEVKGDKEALACLPAKKSFSRKADADIYVEGLNDRINELANRPLD